MPRPTPEGTPVPTRWGHLLIGNPIKVLSTIIPIIPMSPHSLGTPVDWKPLKTVTRMEEKISIVPTRWGHLLIGNSLTETTVSVRKSLSPLVRDTY